MRAFVTGAAGFVGSRLAARLAKDGADVRALVHRNALPAGLGTTVEVVRADLLDRAALREGMRGTEIVFHLASALGSAQIAAEEFSAVNAAGTEAVLAAARDAGVRRVVHFSSAGVLGHIRGGIPAPESRPPAPLDVYSRTKLAGEQIALASARAGQDVVVIRPGWVYGPGDRRTFKLIRTIARRRFVLVGSGKLRQTPVHVDDLVSGTLLCAAKGRPGEIYNLTGSEVLTVRAMAEAIAAAAGVEIPGFALPLGPARAAAWLMASLFKPLKKEAPLNPSRLAFFTDSKPLDIAKAVHELGYAPAFDFKTGIAAAVEWYRANGWL
jgi:nucleoside-diphosphate-sugar epimerase